VCHPKPKLLQRARLRRHGGSTSPFCVLESCDAKGVLESLYLLRQHGKQGGGAGRGSASAARRSSKRSSLRLCFGQGQIVVSARSPLPAGLTRRVR
jgi:hypothetical protein